MEAWEWGIKGRPQRPHAAEILCEAGSAGVKLVSVTAQTSSKTWTEQGLPPKNSCQNVAADVSKPHVSRLGTALGANQVISSQRISGDAEQIFLGNALSEDEAAGTESTLRCAT